MLIWSSASLVKKYILTFLFYFFESQKVFSWRPFIILVLSFWLHHYSSALILLPWKGLDFLSPFSVSRVLGSQVPLRIFALTIIWIIAIVVEFTLFYLLSKPLLLARPFQQYQPNEMLDKHKNKPLWESYFFILED